MANAEKPGQQPQKTGTNQGDFNKRDQSEREQRNTQDTSRRDQDTRQGPGRPPLPEEKYPTQDREQAGKPRQAGQPVQGGKPQAGQQGFNKNQNKGPAPKSQF